MFLHLVEGVLVDEEVVNSLSLMGSPRPCRMGYGNLDMLLLLYDGCYERCLSGTGGSGYNKKTGMFGVNGQRATLLLDVLNLLAHLLNEDFHVDGLQ